MYRIATFLLVIFLTIEAAASDRGGRRSKFNGTFAITKSTVGVLADPRSESARTTNLVFMDAGTRIVVYRNAKKTIANRPHLLSLTESGIWTYVPKRAIFINKKASDFGFSDDDDFVFMTRVQPVDFDGVTVHLSPTERYAVKEYLDNDVLIKAWKEITLSQTSEGRKVAKLEFDVPVPYRKVRIANFDPITERSHVDFFVEGALEKFSAFSKGCGSSSVTKSDISAEAGLGKEFFFFRLSANASEEISTISNFGSEVSVTKKYFTKSKSGGTYSLLTIRECEGENTNETRKYFSKPDHSDIIIDRTFATRYGLSISQSSGEIYVSCYREYDAFRAALIAEGALEDEVDFIIALTADWEPNVAMDKCNKRMIAATAVTISIPAAYVPRRKPNSF